MSALLSVWGKEQRQVAPYPASYHLSQQQSGLSLSLRVPLFLAFVHLIFHLQAIGQQCLVSDSRKRPAFKDVVAMLQPLQSGKSSRGLKRLSLQFGRSKSNQGE